MLKATFEGAVQHAMTYYAQQGTEFSAHDVTKAMRDSAALGQLVLEDRDPATIDGKQTFFIAHGDVRPIVHDSFDDGLLDTHGYERVQGQFLLYRRALGDLPDTDDTALDDQPDTDDTAMTVGDTPDAPANDSNVAALIQKWG